MEFTMADFGFFSGAASWFAMTLAMICVVIFFERRNPSKTMTWLLLLVLLPGVGFVLYLIFGENLRKRNIIKTKRTAEAFLSSEGAKDVYDIYAAIEEQRLWLETEDSDLVFNRDDKQAIKLLLNSGNTPVTAGNKMKLFTEGVSKFDKLLEDISKAQKHIHVEYYIIKDDVIGNRLREALIERAKAGVEVRVLYDDFGCYKLLIKKDFFKSMREAGIELKSFMQDRVLIYRNINYRNHRKIVIIDGEIGYMGGVNVGDEYVHQSKFGFWRDTHLRFEGNIVNMLQLVFLQDWFLRTEEMLIKDKYFKIIDEPAGNAVVQIAASGADSQHPTIYQSYFYNIAHAKKSVYIQTPYFIPDESLVTALKSAILSGVDVRIMFPGSPDHFIVYNASHSYIEEIAELGAKIYFYEKGFIHSKVMMVDHEFASIGTANMDVRSFSINSEINALIYDDDSVNQIYNMFENDMKDCSILDLETYLNKPLPRKFKEALCRLFSPIL